MSKYVDATRSASPKHFYVFDLDRAALDGNVVTDIGSGGVNVVIDEDTGFAEVDVVPPLINGHVRANHPSVIHDAGVNDAAQYYATFNVSGLADEMVGDNAIDDWAIELIIRPTDYSRGRNDNLAALVGFNQTDVDGLMLDYDFTVSPPTVQVLYREDFDEQANLEVLRSASLAVDEVYHIVLVKSLNFYTLYINGAQAAFGTVTETYTSSTLTSNTLKIGGFHSRYHADVDIQTFAFFDETSTLADIQERYEMLAPIDEYAVATDGLTPRISIYNEDEGSRGVIEPELTPIAAGAAVEDFYEDENGTLRLQTSVLAAATTKSKKLHFDLSQMSAGIITFLDITATTDANSSIEVFYSFDDAAYTAWTEGEDNIAELDANWGGAV